MIQVAPASFRSLARFALERDGRLPPSSRNLLTVLEHDGRIPPSGGEHPTEAATKRTRGGEHPTDEHPTDEGKRTDTHAHEEHQWGASMGSWEDVSEHAWPPVNRKQASVAGPSDT